MEHPDDPDYDDDDDDFPKVLKEPEFVPDEFAPFKPLQPVLDRLNDVDRTELIEEIDIEETPLEIAFTTIPDEHYWERAAEERFPVRVIKVLFQGIAKKSRVYVQFS